MLKKLKNRGGSSLLEALFSILIVTLSVTTLLVSVATAMGANKNIKKADKSYKEALEVVEIYPKFPAPETSDPTPPATYPGKIKVTQYKYNEDTAPTPATATFNYNADFYGNKDVYSFGNFEISTGS